MKAYKNIIEIIDSLLELGEVNENVTGYLRVYPKQLSVSLSPKEIGKIIGTLHRKGGLNIAIGHKIIEYNADASFLLQVNSEELLAYREALLDPHKHQSGKGDKKVVTQSSDEKNIRCIDVVEPDEDDRSFDVIINKKYSSPPISLSKKKLSSQFLLELAVKGHVFNTPDARRKSEYLNGHPDNKLYSKKKYQYTKIAKRDGDRIVPVISIENISKSTYKRRLNKESKAP